MIVMLIQRSKLMKCIYCGYEESKVLDSRSTEESNAIRRRRECLNCGKRFTTYETVESIPVLINKRDGSKQPFDINKVKDGISKACDKRPVSLSQMEQISEEIEKYVQNNLKQEISSANIGNIIMERLKALDEIAYIRFASVFKNFNSKYDYINFINNLD